MHVMHAGNRLGGALVLAVLLTALPALAQDDDWAADWSNDESDEAGFDLEIFGFAEALTSTRVVSDNSQSDELLLGEARFQLELRHQSNLESMTVKADFVADGVAREVTIDLREASIYTAPTAWFDLRAGRQVLTWGTGDLVFLNDLFPKDWVSFFAGRADEYLKAPSTSVRTGFYTGSFSLDLVWTPIFEPDRTITGRRMSYFSPFAGAIVGEGAIVDPLDPDLRLRNSEGAARLNWGLGGLELALYGYAGFTKQPAAFDADAGRPTYGRLASYGFSLRNPLLGGIVNLEGAFHQSIDDGDGDDPFLPNSQLRGLLGFEHELVANWTLGLQYYVEAVLDHTALTANSPTPEFEPDQLTHRASLRLTGRVLRDDLMISVFVLGSPNDMDLYVRPSLDYRVTDALGLVVGANLMFGDEPHTFIGQLQHNSNAFGRLRYSF